MLYLVSIIALLLASGMIMLSWVPNQSAAITAFIDAPSLLELLLFDLTILIGSGLLRDFVNAMRLIGTRKRAENLAELQRALEAVSLVRKASATGGFFFLFFQIVLILMWIDDPSHLGPMMAVAILTNLYAQALSLILLPMESRLRTRMEERRELQRTGWEERQERLLRLFEAAGEKMLQIDGKKLEQDTQADGE